MNFCHTLFSYNTLNTENKVTFCGNNDSIWYISEVFVLAVILVWSYIYYSSCCCCYYSMNAPVMVELEGETDTKNCHERIKISCERLHVY